MTTKMSIHQFEDQYTKPTLLSGVHVNPPCLVPYPPPLVQRKDTIGRVILDDANPDGDIFGLEWHHLLLPAVTAHQMSEAIRVKWKHPLL